MTLKLGTTFYYFIHTTLGGHFPPILGGQFYRFFHQSEVLLAQTTYDALGRAKVKTMGNAETVEYAYNIRNWLTDIKAQKFETSLYYNTSPTGLTTQKQWGGNITAATWRQNGGAQQNYRYNYDGLSRIKEGLHSGGYNEKGIEYDSNGNITKLVRDNGFYLGTYNYSYSGNKLTAINNGTAYLYDENGNTKKDGLRGFDIQYNLLNLPKAVSKGTDRLEYIYDAAGNKLVKAAKGSVTYYAGSMVYKEAGGVTSIDYIAHTEGLAVKNGSSFDYQYNLTDHLGNVRNVLDANKNSIQTNDYYPFGLTHGTPANLAKNKYLYNGKELQDDVIGGTLFGILDYGARGYNPIIGRWDEPDPLAEKSRRVSPYVYCSNSPINRIDPDGMLDDNYQLDSVGNITLIETTNDNYDRLYATNNETGEIDKTKSIEVKKGILDNKQTGTRVEANKEIPYDYYVIQGDDNAKSLFEFVAKNTNVEWGHVMFGKDSNFVGTAHKASSDIAGVELVQNLNRLYKAFSHISTLSNMFIIRGYSHSHPLGTEPSGYDTMSPNYDSETLGDKAFAKWAHRKNINAPLKVYQVTKSKYVTFNINGFY